MIQTTNLSDTWSRCAEQAAAEPPPSRPPAPRQRAPASQPSPLVKKIGITPEQLHKLSQSGLVVPAGVALPVAKNGTPITSSQTLSQTSSQTLSNPSCLQSQWLDVTPAMATRWLKNNFRNRPISQDIVTAYARDMRLGLWTATHQGIAFNDRDELIDGQHRLLAIVQSGRTIRIMVTFGLPSKIEGSEMTTMDAVDRGRTRSVGDQLLIQHGIKQGGVIAAICAALSSLCWEKRCRRLSVGQSLAVFREFEPAIHWLIERRSKQHGLRATGVLAAFAFAMTAENTRSQAITRMFESLNGPEALPLRSPIAKLREFLTSEEAKLLLRGHDRGVAEMTLQAIHLSALNIEIERLTCLLDGAKHYRTLQAARADRVAKLFAETNP